MEPYANPVAPAGVPEVPMPDEPGWEDYYLNQNPEAAFWKWLERFNLQGNRPVDTWSQGQQKRTYDTYQAQAGNDPNQGFWDYLQKNQPNYENEYMQQAPSRRGDYTSQTHTPRARWVSAG